MFAFKLTQSAGPDLLVTASVCRFPYGVGMMAAQPSAPVQYTGQPTGPGGQPAPQLRPLFPSAQPGTPSPGPPTSRATFPGKIRRSHSPSILLSCSPAYSAESEVEKKPQLIASTGSSSKIIHPAEDISLVSSQSPVRQSPHCPPSGGAEGGDAQVQASSGGGGQPGWAGGGQLRPPDDDAQHGGAHGPAADHGGRRLTAPNVTTPTAAAATTTTFKTRPGARDDPRPPHAAAGRSASLHGSARPRESASGMASPSSSSSALASFQIALLGRPHSPVCFVCYLFCFSSEVSKPPSNSAFTFPR